MPASLIERALRALREERPEDAQAYLVNILAGEPENDEAWMLLADALVDPALKHECLEHAFVLNPENPAILRALTRLSTREPQPAPVAPAPARERIGRAEKPPVSGSFNSLLRYAEMAAVAVALTTRPDDTREMGTKLLKILDQAAKQDVSLTRRWTRSAGRTALIKIEKALTAMIASAPRDDPALDPLRSERQRALEFLRR